MTQSSLKIDYVDNILSHRISADKGKYEYECKVNNIDSSIWLAESFISTKNLNLLEAYKQKVDLIPISNCLGVYPNILQNNDNDEENDKEFDMVDFTKFIALDFNESFGIKLEVGIEYNEFEIKTSDVPELSSNIKIKSENLEHDDINLEKEIEKDNMETVDQNCSIDNSKSTDGDSCKEIESQLPRKLGTDNKRSHETNNVIQDPVISLFDDLPVAPKIAIDMRDISISQLPKISETILRDFAEKGSIDVLQKFMLSDQKESLQNIVKHKPSIMVLAAKNNFLHLVSAFISLGVNINGLDQTSKTALMCACVNENEDLIDLLVNNGAAMNIHKNRKHSILYLCCRENKPKSLSTLLKFGADFTRIKLKPPYSLIEYSKKKKLNEITKIVENHLASLTVSIKNIIKPLVGSKIKIIRIIPICVLSPIEFTGEIIECSFDFDVSQQNLNHFTMCFLLTGLILGSEMKCLYSEAHRITSVSLNGTEQQSFTAGCFKTITAFSPLQSQNLLKITGENLKCRKTRLIVTACTVELIE